MLTDAHCRAAKPKEQLYRLNDLRGLYLEVKPSGVKAWRYRFKLAKEGQTKESLFAIGDYASAPNGETPDEAKARRAGGRFTLAEAREERIKARALVKQGINPAHNRQLDRIKREQANATTFETVAREWLALKDWEEVTRARRLDMLARVVFPKIGALPIKTVTPAHILDVLNTSAKKNGLTVAAEAKRTMSGVFEHAVSTLRADADPAAAVGAGTGAGATVAAPAASGGGARGGRKARAAAASSQASASRATARARPLADTVPAPVAAAAAGVDLWEQYGMMCSANERRADEASRDVEAWLKCQYMRERVGEQFAGRITGVAPFGVFVTLNELYVEGLVHVSELGTEYFQYIDGVHELRGERTGRRFRLTDELHVQVSRVDLEARRIEFRLVQKQGFREGVAGAGAPRGDGTPSQARRKAAAPMSEKAGQARQARLEARRGGGAAAPAPASADARRGAGKRKRRR